MQRLLTTAKWDVDAVRNELRCCVGEWFGDPHSIIVVSQAAFTKRGRHSAGVKQQYNEDSQRVENCQLGLFLGYATPYRTILIDRELYLPEEWRHDNERRTRARIPETAFASRSALAIRMIDRVLDSELPMSWISTAELADTGPAVHEWLTIRQVPHIAEIRPSAPVQVQRGQRMVRASARELLRQAPTRQWQQLWQRGRFWARVLLRTDSTRDSATWLVVQRMRDRRQDRYYVASGPAGTALAELARAAQAAGGVKTALARAKDRVGLDHYEARRYEAWYRHVTLALFADALLEAHTHRPVPALGNGVGNGLANGQPAGQNGYHTSQTMQGARGRCLHHPTRSPAIMPAAIMPAR